MAHRFLGCLKSAAGRSGTLTAGAIARTQLRQAFRHMPPMRYRGRLKRRFGDQMSPANQERYWIPTRLG